MIGMGKVIAQWLNTSHGRALPAHLNGHHRISSYIPAYLNQIAAAVLDPV
jgi:hypothetical protein